MAMFDPLAESEFQTCTVCRRIVDTAAHATVHSIKVVKLEPQRGRRYVDGSEVVFHDSCFPATSPRYRRLSLV